MRITGSGMGDADPPEGGEFDFEILDSKGRHAPWLEKKLTDADEERLYEEFTVEVDGQRYGYIPFDD
jgi:hypothetical protein